MDAMTIGFTRSSLGALRTVKTTGLPTISGLWFNNINQQTHISRRSHWGENTGSHLNSEVKHSKAGLVLGWGTAWEPHGNDGFFFSFAVSRLFTSRRQHLTRHFSGGPPGNPTMTAFFFLSVFGAFTLHGDN